MTEQRTSTGDRLATRPIRARRRARSLGGMSFAAFANRETPRDLGPDRLSMCLACGARMADCLIRTGSPRCHDCRDAHAPLRADLVLGGSRRPRLVPDLEPAYELPRAA